MSSTNDLMATFAARRPKSAALFERAKQVLGGAVGHDLRYSLPMPLYIQRGRGGRKWDIDGNEYVDFLMGNGALLLGHADLEVVYAISRAAAFGTHFGNDHPLHIEWAELVQRLIPCAERVRFTNSGTEATQLALRIARAATGRNRILRFAGHFHGWHDDVVHGFQPPFDADGSLGVPPHVRQGLITIPDGDLNLLDDTLAASSDIAAVILEPSGASWGRVPIDPDWLRGVRESTARRGVLLIFDEVVTGFRFHSGGAQTLYGITPDLCCLAKVMAGGMPGGAVGQFATRSTHHRRDTSQRNAEPAHRAVSTANAIRRRGQHEFHRRSDLLGPHPRRHRSSHQRLRADCSHAARRAADLFAQVRSGAAITSRFQQTHQPERVSVRFECRSTS